MPIRKEMQEALLHHLRERGNGGLAKKPPTAPAPNWRERLANLTQPPAEDRSQPTEALSAPSAPPDAPAETAVTIPSGRGPSEERFVREYLRHGRNPTKAAEVAGYPTPWIDGPNLLRRPKIKAFVAMLDKASISEEDLTAGDIRLQLARIIKRKTSSVFHSKEEGGGIMHPSELPDDIAATIESIKHGPNGWEYKFEKKLPALNLGAELLGIKAAQRVEHTVTGRINIASLSDEELMKMIDQVPDTPLDTIEGQLSEAYEIQDAEFEPSDS